ncbi:MAG TPA: hypothetical protein VFE27_05500 [Acidobacteriaceae bacterium]|nr:hypothetical protein [Acidobacteriaceae bacterium]
MRTLSAVAGAALLAWNLAGLARAETPCGQTLDAPLRPRAVLTIHSRPAGLEIVGTDQAAIHISCTSGDEGDAQRIRIRSQGNQDDETLTIAGDSLEGGNLRVRIEVPRKTSLRVEMSAGEVKVEEVTGDKDINLYAGQITISSTRSWDYRKVDVSVSIGAVNAPVYGAQKGGFFRGITKETANGEYSLYAHVITGQIDLLGRSLRPTTD